MTMPVKHTVLYIDRPENLRQSFPEKIKKDYKIFSADSYNAGLEILQRETIHILIAEQNLPEETGIRFLRSLGEEFSAVMKILTGRIDNKATILQALNSGVVFRFLVKPWQKTDLQKILDEAVVTFRENEKIRELLFSLDHKYHEMNFLHEISQKISEKKPLATLLYEIMESSKMVMNAEASSLLLYNPDEKKLQFQVATGEKGKMVSKFNVDLGVGIAGWVAKHKKPLLIKDCYNDPRFSPEYDKRTKFKTKSMICVPLVRKKQLLGVMQVINKKDGNIFNESDLTIFETLAGQCAISIENAKLIEIQVETEALERELETAREIQEKLLPSSLPEYEDIRIAAKLIPAKMVGGDYFNIFKINDKESLFFIADVSGKGIPAALIVSTIYSCLVTYLKMNERNFDLLTMVSSMNKVLLDATTIDKYATCWFGLYNHETNKLVSVNAGHNPPYIFNLNSDAPQSLHKGGIFLGFIDGSYKKEEVQMQPGNVLVFFTDGVTEAWNKKEEEYEEFRLIEVINKHKFSDADKILAEIEKDVQKHVGKADQSDDITCVVVKW